MPASYEYPPSLTHYRPLQFDRTGIYPAALRLRHNFFVTRIKIVFQHLIKVATDVRLDLYIQEEIHNVLISQGWCAVLGVPVPTPFFLQEFLLGFDTHHDPRHLPALVKLFMTLEITDSDRFFHDDIMRGRGEWWRHSSIKPLGFKTLWRMLEERTSQLAAVGILPPKPWKEGEGEIGQNLDPAPHDTSAGPSFQSIAPEINKEMHRQQRTTAWVNHLVQMLDDLGIPDIELSELDIQDLENIDHLSHAQLQLERLQEIEADIVDNEKWNHDAAKGLLDLADTMDQIPFNSRSELYDLHATAAESEQKGGNSERPSQEAIGVTHKSRGPSVKGKERAEDQKRSIYNLLPDDSKETWLPKAEAIPAMKMNEYAKTFPDLLNKEFPDLFGMDAPPHNCIYRKLLSDFVKEDIQKGSRLRLTEFLLAQEDVMDVPVGHWDTYLPLKKIPVPSYLYNRKSDPVPGIFGQIAALAAAPIPESPLEPPNSDSDTDSEAVDVEHAKSLGIAAQSFDTVREVSHMSQSDDSSEWESQESDEDGMETEALPLDFDGGGATFATS